MPQNTGRPTKQDGVVNSLMTKKKFEHDIINSMRSLLISIRTLQDANYYELLHYILLRCFSLTQTEWSKNECLSGGNVE